MLMADGWRGVALLCRSGRSQLFPESLDLMERNGAQRRDHPLLVLLMYVGAALEPASRRYTCVVDTRPFYPTNF